MHLIQAGDLILKLSKECSSSDDVILKENSIYQMLTLTTYSNVTYSDVPNFSNINNFEVLLADQRNLDQIQPALYNQKLNEELSKENFEDHKINDEYNFEISMKHKIKILERENRVYKINQNELINR